MSDSIRFSRPQPAKTIPARAVPVEEEATRTAAPEGATLERYCPSRFEIRAKIWRGVWSPWSVVMVVAALVVVTLAYQVPLAYDIELGGGFDTPYLNLVESGFGTAVQTRLEEDDLAGRTALNPAPARAIAPEPVRQNYRWTRERPILLLPGIGAAPGRLTLLAAGSPLVPAGQQIEVLLNGQPFSRFDLKPGDPILRQFDLKPQDITGGSLAVEMRVKALGPVDTRLAEQYPGTYPALDNRNGRKIYQGENGFKLYTARLELFARAGPVTPPAGVALALVVTAWLVWLGLAYTGLPGRIAGGVALLLTVALGLVLAFSRLSLTIFTSRLALLLAVAVVMLPVLDWAVPRLLRRWRLPLPGWAWTALLVLFLTGLIGRGGGVLYPHTEIIDAPYHLRETLKILREPDGVVRQYTNRELSKVPDQWGSQAIIPYSTLTYFYTAPLAALPLDPAITLPLFNALLDALRVFAIFALAAALGAGAIGATVAAAIYLILPCTWLLNSWGNWPTTLTLWMATLYLTLVVVEWRRLHHPGWWAGLTALLLAAMMGYAVTAVFMGLLLYGWGWGLVVFAGRRDRLVRRNGWLLLASATTAGVLAILLYYIQFLPDLTATLQSFDQSLQTKGSLGGFGDRSFDFYLGLYSRDVFLRYGVGAFIVISGAVFGWAVFSRRPRQGDPFEVQTTGPHEAALRYPAWLWLAASWLLVFGLFGVAQWKVDMVNKQVWFVLPLAAALGGVGLVWLWQRASAPLSRYVVRAAVSGLVLWTVYGAVALWIYRVFIKRR